MSPRSPARKAQASSHDPAEAAREAAGPDIKKKAKPADKKLDEAMELTFPASDPAAAGRATGNEGSSRPTDRRAPVITKEEIERASAGLDTGNAVTAADRAAEEGERIQRKIDGLDRAKAKGKAKSRRAPCRRGIAHTPTNFQGST